MNLKPCLLTFLLAFMAMEAYAGSGKSKHRTARDVKSQKNVFPDLNPDLHRLGLDSNQSGPCVPGPGESHFGLPNTHPQVSSPPNPSSYSATGPCNVQCQHVRLNQHARLKKQGRWRFRLGLRIRWGKRIKGFGNKRSNKDPGPLSILSFAAAITSIVWILIQSWGFYVFILAIALGIAAVIVEGGVLAWLGLGIGVGILFVGVIVLILAGVYAIKEFHKKLNESKRNCSRNCSKCSGVF